MPHLVDHLFAFCLYRFLHLEGQSHAQMWCHLETWIAVSAFQVLVSNHSQWVFNVIITRYIRAVYKTAKWVVFFTTCCVSGNVVVVLEMSIMDSSREKRNTAPLWVRGKGLSLGDGACKSGLSASCGHYGRNSFAKVQEFSIIIAAHMPFFQPDVAVCVSDWFAHYRRHTSGWLTPTLWPFVNSL